MNLPIIRLKGILFKCYQNKTNRDQKIKITKKNQFFKKRFELQTRNSV